MLTSSNAKRERVFTTRSANVPAIKPKVYMRHFPTKDRGSNNPPKLRTATLRMSLVYVDCGVSGKKFLWKALAFERKSIKIGLVKNGGCYVQFMKDFFTNFKSMSMVYVDCGVELL